MEHHGEVPERLNGTVLKTVVAPKVTGGSNPSLSVFFTAKAWRALILRPAFRAGSWTGGLPAVDSDGPEKSGFPVSGPVSFFEGFIS